MHYYQLHRKLYRNYEISRNRIIFSLMKRIVTFFTQVQSLSILLFCFFPIFQNFQTHFISHFSRFFDSLFQELLERIFEPIFARCLHFSPLLISLPPNAASPKLRTRVDITRFLFFLLARIIRTLLRSPFFRFS